MRALVCDWCAAVTTTREGWYEVQPAGASRHAAFDDAPRTFCGLDCLGDYVDVARTSPTGDITGAAPVPEEVDLGAVLAEVTPVATPEPEIPRVQPPAAEPGLRPAAALVGLASHAEDTDTAPAEPDADEPPVPEVAPVPLRGLGRGLGRTGS